MSKFTTKEISPEVILVQNFLHPSAVKHEELGGNTDDDFLNADSRKSDDLSKNTEKLYNRKSKTNKKLEMV